MGVVAALVGTIAMRFFVWCELVCGTCATTLGGQFTLGSTVPRRQLQRLAKDSGWQFAHNDVFCSKRCLAQREKQDDDDAA